MLCTVRIVYRSPPNRYTQSSYVRPVYCAVLRGGSWCCVGAGRTGAACPRGGSPARQTPAAPVRLRRSAGLPHAAGDPPGRHRPHCAGERTSWPTQTALQSRWTPAADSVAACRETEAAAVEVPDVRAPR